MRADQIIALLRGKSGLHWTRRQVTPGRRKFTESAAENIPPLRGKGEKVW